jgi:hypothetical protein
METELCDEYACRFGNSTASPCMIRPSALRISGGSLGVSSLMRSGQKGHRGWFSCANASRSKSLGGINPRSGRILELWPVSGSTRTSMGVRVSRPVAGSIISAVNTWRVNSISAFKSQPALAAVLIAHDQHRHLRGGDQALGHAVEQ